MDSIERRQMDENISYGFRDMHALWRMYQVHTHTPYFVLLFIKDIFDSHKNVAGRFY